MIDAKIGQKITLKWANDPYLGHLWGYNFEIVRRSQRQVSNLLPQKWNNYVHWFIIRELVGGDEIELSNSEIEMSFELVGDEQ